MKFLILVLFSTFLYLNISAEDVPKTKSPPSKNFVNDEPNKEPSWKEEHWIEVPLDHFNLFDNRTWKMRYFINDEFFQEGGPLFVEIGGEWTVTGRFLTRGQSYTLAKKHHGFLLATEHRYYGKSLPFSTDFSKENLRYLQIEQALEDKVYLIEYLKASTPGLQNSTVAVHGCSYGGMLATWLRSRFPHVVDIGYASSAPLGVGLDYPEYYEVVHDVYANVSGSCIDTIKKGFNDTQTLLKTKDGRKTVRNTLKGWDCGDIDYMGSNEIIWKMIMVLNVQYDSVQYEDIGCLVMAMDTDDLTDFERLANFIILKSKDTGRCSSSDFNEEKLLMWTAWLYQVCTEVGFFQTLNSKNSRHPFAVDRSLEESVEMCVRLYGEGVTEELIKTGIERTNRRYGGKHPRITKLLTVHGTSDPWRALGKSEETDPDAPVIIVKGSHCVDDSTRSDDPPDVIKSRENIRNILSNWIEEIERNKK